MSQETSAPTLLSQFVSWWRKIGGGSFALSLAIHALLLTVAGLLLIRVVQEQPAVDFMPGSRADHGDSEPRHQVRTTQQKTLARAHPVARITAPKGPVMLPAEPLPEFSDLLEAISSPVSVGSMVSPGFGLDGLGGPGKGHGHGSRDGMTPFLRLTHGRCDMAERLQKLREYDGDERCEIAVSKALEWLHAKQAADGSWGRQHKGAMTGFALLCYLGRCYDADSLYGETVTRAMLQLVEMAQKNPRHIFSEKPEQHAACYEHGIATYALGEMWSFMKLGKKQMPGVREAFERGVAVIIEHQLPDGGWGYGDDFCYRKTGAGDLSVTGWQFQALKAAHYSGLRIEGLQKSIDRAVEYLASKQTKEGGFGGANREQGYNQWNLTGVGLLGLQTLGKGRTREIKRGVDFAHEFIGKEPPHWERNANLYTWYYLAQALFQSGGEPWKQWNQAVLPQLLANQNSDGSWKPETADSNVASTAPAGADRELYRTALCTLMLEVYYRYLKVGDPAAKSVFER